ncbi:helix-turn-helix transcriptional regulator [Paenibacillus sp. strain BS8-2]
MIDCNQNKGLNWYDESTGNDGYARLVIVTYGRCLYFVGGVKHIAERGDFIYLPPGISYYGKSVPTVFHEKLVFTFSIFPKSNIESRGAADHLPLFEANQIVQAKAGCYELTLERIRVACAEWEDQVPYSRIRMSAAVIEALALWSRELDRGQETDVSLQHADKMKSYIQTHYRDKITKETLGDHIGRSPNHAAALFRRVTGQTISDYVHGARMRTAAYMLSESLLTIAEISDYLGYADVSYFQRVFKRTWGCSPSRYLSKR